MGGGEPGRLKRLSLTCWLSPGEDGLVLRGAHGYLGLCRGRPGAEEGTALLSEITELRRRLGAKQVQNWKSTASGKTWLGVGVATDMTRKITEAAEKSVPGEIPSIGGPDNIPLRYLYFCRG